MNAFAAAREAGREEELQTELIALFERQNASVDASRSEIPATFRVTAVKPE